MNICTNQFKNVQQKRTLFTEKEQKKERNVAKLSMNLQIKNKFQ